MGPWEIGFLLVLALPFWGLPVIWALRLAACYPPPRRPLEAGRLPRVAVLLSLRGADPSLPDCLRGLLSQNYPDYTVHIVLDCATDPAGEVVGRVLAESPRGADIRVRELARRRDSCSLKMSALVQFLEDLDESFEVVALLDADVIPYPDWLRDLVVPLAEPGVGAAVGLRWYCPARASWGALVRTIWNGAACSQMVAFHIAWAGSLALPVGVIRRARLAEEWSRSFCEDTRVHDSLRPLGLRLRFVPAATMVNHEDIGLGGCFSFIRRQLLTTRLHHRSWPAILALNLGSSLGLTLAPAVIALAILTGHTGLAWALAAAVAVYGAGMTVGLFGVHHALIGMARRRGARTPPFPWQIFLAAPLVPAIHLAALVSACFLRRATWRGIPYEVRGPGQPVRLLAYHPYRPEAGADRRPASLV